MHMCAEIWLPYYNAKTLEVDIMDILDPYKEGECENGFWDWYLIGGRFAGNHDNYNPKNDDANYSVCKYCGGTGKRQDYKGADGCNACSGTKKMRHHFNRSYDGDVMRLDQVMKSCCTYTVIVKNIVSHIGETLPNKSVTEFIQETYGITDGWLVTVDYHS